MVKKALTSLGGPAANRCALSPAPDDQALLLLEVRDLELFDRDLDRGLLVRCVDVAKEPPALADQRDFPGEGLLWWWLLRHTANNNTARAC
jgi:hypothetical protein